MIPEQRIMAEHNYSDALGCEIIELIGRTENKQLLYNELLDMLGDHETIRLKIDELLFNNLLLKIPVKLGNVKDFVLAIPKREQTAWNTMICPCFTCNKINECAINNPVNPVKCKSFNEWLIAEDNTNSITPFLFEEFDIIEEEEIGELL